jgi:hypothetical protein
VTKAQSLELGAPVQPSRQRPRLIPLSSYSTHLDGVTYLERTNEQLAEYNKVLSFIPEATRLPVTSFRLSHTALAKAAREAAEAMREAEVKIHHLDIDLWNTKRAMLEEVAARDPYWYQKSDLLCKS